MALIERAKNILLQPAREWEVIAKEPADTAGLYTGYVLPLAAVGPVASFIGMAFIGVSLPFAGTFRVPLGAALGHSVVSYVLTLVGVFVLALIINALAPTFGGTKDSGQALKVAVYASTAAWLANVFALVPMLALLSLLGLYSLYLLYLGLPALMKAPKDKAMGYTAVVVVCAIVLFAVTGVIAGMFISYPAMTPPAMGFPGIQR